MASSGTPVAGGCHSSASITRSYLPTSFLCSRPAKRSYGKLRYACSRRMLVAGGFHSSASITRSYLLTSILCSRPAKRSYGKLRYVPSSGTFVAGGFHSSASITRSYLPTSILCPRPAKRSYGKLRYACSRRMPFLRINHPQLSSNVSPLFPTSKTELWQAPVRL